MTIQTSVEEWIIGSTYIVFAILNSIIITVHSRKVYLDLFTTERKSLSHKRSKSLRITKQYKTMTWLTLADVIAFGSISIFSVYSYNFAFVQNKLICTILAPVVLFPFQLSKPLMYLVFIYRLYQVYGQSAYGYKTSTLWCLAITIVIMYLCHAIITSVTLVIDGDWIGDYDGKYPFHCFTYTSREWAPIVGGIQAALDIVLGIGAVIMFQVPLNRLFKELEKTHDISNDIKKSRKKMMKVGYKYKTLVFSAFITTLIWMLSAILGDGAGTNVIAATVAPLDFTVNMICLMLMTPYYPDNVYYERLCRLCIYCNARKGESYKSRATPEARKLEIEMNGLEPTANSSGNVPVPDASPVPSVDTMDEIEIVAKRADPNNLLSPDFDD